MAGSVADTGVTINALCPGWVETQMSEQAVARVAQQTGRSAADARKTLEAMSPQRRMIQPLEVMEAYATAFAKVLRDPNALVGD